MKNIILFLILILNLSCSQVQLDDSEIYSTIAQDELYHEFHEAMAVSAMNMVSNIYDLEKIHSYWISVDGEKPFCDFNLDSEALEIKGIQEYQESSCLLDKTRSELVKKYPIFDTFSKSEYSEIRKLHAETYGDSFLKSLKSEK